MGGRDDLRSERGSIIEESRCLIQFRDWRE